MGRSEQIKVFFAAFTHDLKTSLASLRLQAESLQEDLKDSEHRRLTQRLVKDTVRLELQLENSLYIAGPKVKPIHLEQLLLKDVLESISHHWPDMAIELKQGLLAARRC